MREWWRDGRVAAVALAALSLFPGPWLLLSGGGPSANDPVARALSGEIGYWIGATLLLVVPGAIIALLAGERGDRFLERAAGGVTAVPRVAFVGAAAGFAIAAAALAAWYCFSFRPTTSDEVAQLWHARILLTGRLFLPADPDPALFAIDNVIDRQAGSDRWFSQFPIGGPAVLAAALWTRLPWLIGPLLAGWIVVSVYRLATRAFDEATARVAAALTALSPFVLLMSASYMNHTVVLALVAAALPPLADWMRGSTKGVWRAAAAIGLALGCAITVRPLDGAIAAVVIGGAMILTARGDGRRLVALSAGAVAGAIPLALLFVANARTTGDPLRFGYDLLWGANHGLGFHPDPSGNLHTPGRALSFAVSYATQLNWSLLDWPVPGMILPVIALVCLRRLGRWDGLLLIWFVVQLVAYALYWHAGQFVGPRYLFTIVPSMLVLAARGVVLVPARLPVPARRAFAGALAGCVAGAWLLPTPPYGAVGGAPALRVTRMSMKLDPNPALAMLTVPEALIVVPELVSQRLARRLWALGIPRGEAGRLIARADGCALLEGVRAEETRSEPSTAGERVARLEGVRAFIDGPERVLANDASFRVTDSTAVTPACSAELLADASRAISVAFGPLMVRNPIDAAGRIAGPVVFVADLGERGPELYRRRFGDRPWYRLEVPIGGTGPVLVPYK